MIKIITDATNDFTAEYYEKNNIHLLPMEINIDGEVFVDNKAVDLHNFYDNLRKEKMPTTSMINPASFEEVFEKYLSQGYDVLYVGFSSGLSGTFNASIMAQKILSEKYPNSKILCVDSLSASMGIGILVKKAVELRDNGKTIEEIFNRLEQLKHKIHICLGVDNLFHLQRGGRISKGAAIVGTALQLKPIIKVDEKGKLVSFKKVMGRKKLSQTLLEFVVKFIDESEKDNVYILHGDCFKDAEELKTKLDSTLNLNSQIFSIGTIIGSHTGADALAIIYISKEDKKSIK